MSLPCRACKTIQSVSLLEKISHCSKNPTNLPNPKWLPSLSGSTGECKLGEHDSSRVEEWPSMFWWRVCHLFAGWVCHVSFSSCGCVTILSWICLLFCQVVLMRDFLEFSCFIWLFWLFQCVCNIFLVSFDCFDCFSACAIFNIFTM